MTVRDGYETAGFGANVYPVATEPMDNAARMAHWLRENAPPLFDCAAADWDHWAPTPVEVGHKPTRLLRVGHVVGLDGGEPPLAMMGNLGDSHTNLDLTLENLDVAQGILLRMLGSVAPGAAKVLLYNGRFTRKFTDFGGLNHLIEHISSEELEDTLSRIIRFQEGLTARTIKPAYTVENPALILVMVGDPDLTDRGREKLNRLIMSGCDWGALLGLGVHGLHDYRTIQDGPPVMLRKPEYGWDCVYDDPPPPSELICRTVAQIANAASSRKIAPVNELYQGTGERLSTATGIEAEIGIGLDGDWVTASFNDGTPHGLLEGPSGGGKSNFLRALISRLIETYSEDELSLWVVDSKGVGLTVFGQFADSEKYAPQVKVMGGAVTDPEDWIAILKELNAEMDRRYSLMASLGRNKLDALRAKRWETDPDDKLPRIMLVWDEIGEVFRSDAGHEAILLLDRLASLAREAGIHLLLATQEMDVVAIGARNFMERFTLRISLQGGNNLMDISTNRGFTQTIPKHGVGLNTNGGVYRDSTDNKIAYVPRAEIEDAVVVRDAEWRRRKSSSAPPATLGGGVLPKLERQPAFTQLKPVAGMSAAAMVGMDFGTKNEVVEFDLGRVPGTNLAIIGTRTEEVLQAMGSMVRSVPEQHTPGSVRISVLCTERPYFQAAQRAVANLQSAGHHAQLFAGSDAVELIQSTAGEVTDGQSRPEHYIFAYGINGIQTYDLKTVLDDGPLRGVHVIGAWSGFDRLSDSAGGRSAFREDSVQGYVMLNASEDDIHMITSTYKHPWATANSGRRGRALYLDRRSGKPPKVIQLFANSDD